MDSGGSKGKVEKRRRAMVDLGDVRLNWWVDEVQGGVRDRDVGFLCLLL